MAASTCVIIGTGPGMGLAIARRFGREGFRLALVARRADMLNGHVRALAADGLEAHAFPADAADDSSLRGAFEVITTLLGPVDVLVYNAARIREAAPSTLDRFAVESDFRINVIGALSAAQQVIPGMRQRGRGTILFTGGGLAVDPRPQYASLALGKAALRNLCYSLAWELQPDGIHVATVTIAGGVTPGTHFDPDTIAEVYWQLHRQPHGEWEAEVVYQ